MKAIVVAFCLFSSLFSCFSQEKIAVYFDFNKYELNPTALTALNDWILAQPDSKVLKIYGFCDWKGTSEYNDTLSLQRVQTVFEYLTEHKIAIDKDYLQKGFGKNFTQDKNQALNRKVEIEYSNAIPQAEKQIKEKNLAESFKIAQKGDVVRLKNINFYNNSARIVPKSESTLYDLLCVMQENPKLKIEIQGHICCQLSTSLDHISTARARAIYNHLIRNKIARNRLSYKGYGVSQPIYPIPEKSDFEENENRRVEIKILEN
ncbi:OmpA family protein [Flavobacterium antarcticum]|uniref:OmpA family protein n=1 Tax=Flavobacterium antarcticum TaxID=271155 RepID=UPI0003B4C64D|nr:OmpA family protein [Flavobacterium antarcticum]